MWERLPDSAGQITHGPGPKAGPPPPASLVQAQAGAEL